MTKILTTCVCHGIPHINSNDNICRIKWAEYEALLYFIGKGLTKDEASKCIEKLDIERKMSKFKDEFDKTVSDQLLIFQQKSRTTLSEKECKNIARSCKTKTKPKDKSKVKQKSKVRYVIHNNVRRPICMTSQCERLSKIRYYKGSARFDRYCDLGKDHFNNTKRANYQKEYQRRYRELKGIKGKE